VFIRSRDGLVCLFPCSFHDEGDARAVRGMLSFFPCHQITSHLLTEQSVPGRAQPNSASSPSPSPSQSQPNKDASNYNYHYVSPSDKIMSPCTRKLSDLKERRLLKYVFSFSLSLLSFQGLSFSCSCIWMTRCYVILSSSIC
jgi:Spo12 family